MRGIEKLLGYGSAPSWTLDPGVFCGNGFAVSRARFIHTVKTRSHDERTKYVWCCSDIGESRVPLLVIATRSVYMGRWSPCRSPTRLCSPCLETPSQRVRWSAATYPVTCGLLLRTPRYVAPRLGYCRRRTSFPGDPGHNRRVAIFPAVSARSGRSWRHFRGSTRRAMPAFSAAPGRTGPRYPPRPAPSPCHARGRVCGPRLWGSTAERASLPVSRAAVGCPRRASVRRFCSSVRRRRHHDGSHGDAVGVIDRNVNGKPLATGPFVS